MSHSPPQPVTHRSFQQAPNKIMRAAGTTFAYRELGKDGGTPVVLLNHWGAVLDNFDPRIVDGLALHHRVIAVDYRGIGLSGGTAPVTVAEMAEDTISLICAMGFEQFDVFGFSLGGFVAQDVALKAPNLVRRLVLAGIGPAGGKGIDRIWSLTWPLMIKGLLTLRDPKTYLFFTSTRNGRKSADVFLKRLKERAVDRDKAPTPRAFLNQVKAIKSWGRQEEQDLTRLQIPVLVVNGDHDIMVPTPLTFDMARRIPQAECVIYPDAGHGAAFQYHTEFLQKALNFLA